VKQYRELLIFDRLLTIVRVFEPGDESKPGLPVSTGQHLGKLIEKNTCHEIIEWWAEAHERGKFTDFSILAESFNIEMPNDSQLEPLLLPDGRAEHMLLSLIKPEGINTDQAAIHSRLLDEVISGETLEAAASVISSELLFASGANKLRLVIYPNSLSARPLVINRSREGERLGKNVSINKSDLSSLLMKNENAVSKYLYLFQDDRKIPDQEIDFESSSMILLPIYVGGRIFGYCQFIFRQTVNDIWQKRVLRQEQRLVELVVLLLVKILMSEQTVAPSLLANLKNVTTRLRTSLSNTDVSEPVVKAAVGLRSVDSAAIYSLEGEKLVITANSGKQLLVSDSKIPLGRGPVGLAAYSLKIQKNESSEDGDDAAEKLNIYSLSIPITALSELEGEETEIVTGVLHCESNSSELFEDQLIDALQVLVTFASLANENFELMQQSLELLATKSQHARMLEEKRYELNEFIHSVSHDLKNPLSNIDGFAELMSEDLIDGKSDSLERYIKRIRANSSFVMKILNDLLELSRVGKIDGNLDEIPLHDMLREIIFDFSHSDETLKIKVNFDSIPKTINANHHRLTQVFNNLITNAIKYADPLRQPAVIIDCFQEGNYWHFTLEDNGIGVAEEHLKDIFIFGSRIRENDAEGTGAGLAICKRIVETHGGTMWAESEKEKFTRIHFTIPKSNSEL
jgi:signal transduction histidine kinase